MDRAPGWYDDPDTAGLKRWWTGSEFDATRVLRAPGTYSGDGVPGGEAYWSGTAWESSGTAVGTKVSLLSVVVAMALVVALVVGTVVWKVSTSPGSITTPTLSVPTETPHSASACAQLHSLTTFLGQLGPFIPISDEETVAQVGTYGELGLLASENSLSALGHYASSIEGLSTSERSQLSSLSGYLVVAQKNFSLVPNAAAAVAKAGLSWSNKLNNILVAAEVAARRVSAHSAVVAGLATGCAA